jgi:hypothetical protein
MLALTLAGLGSTVIVGFVLVVLLISWFSNPPFGLGNAPPQPVAFPHTAHAAAPEAGGAGIACEFCHRNVTKGEAATVPAVEQCLFCHDLIEGTTATAIAEIAKFRPVGDGQALPINWERVHRLPDHVRFVHEAHIRALTQMDGSDRSSVEKVQNACTVCHGDVAGMTEVKPKRFQSLKMGTCLDCHRFLSLVPEDQGYVIPAETDIPTDCTLCHK